MARTTLPRKVAGRGTEQHASRNANEPPEDHAARDASDTSVIDWLLQGDAAIRWQTLRDVQRRPARVWQAERAKTLREGWGAALLALQDEDGRWAGGVYTPKWTSTTYTLLTLLHIGVPNDGGAVPRGVECAVDGLLGRHADAAFRTRLVKLDRCIVGMLLAMTAYVGLRDARSEALLDNALDEVMPDGAWNCQKGRHKPEPTHSSFNTTFNVLDGLQQYLESGARRRRGEVLAARTQALEFMLQHRLYRSHRTGAVARNAFTQLSFPPRWHYDVLRGLDFFARVDAEWDQRLQDPLALLLSKRDRGGRWPLQNEHRGQVFFKMERAGHGSRWNTLRALRVLGWAARRGVEAAT